MATKRSHPEHRPEHREPPTPRSEPPTKPDHGPLLIGKEVWYYSSPGADPCTAKIAWVKTPQSVNLGVLDHEGTAFNRHGVLFVQEGESSQGNEYCTWPGTELPAPSDPDLEQIDV